MEALIKVNNLCVNYKAVQKEEGLRGSISSFFHHNTVKIPAIKDLNLEVMPGEILGLIGPNGAGKSTTLKSLSGIITPDSGEISVAGFKPYKRSKQFLKSIALVAGQRTQLWLDLPATETFRLHQLIYNIPEERYKKQVEEMVDMLKIEHRIKVPVRQLSLGERLKMELILAFIHEPKVLFLDEPTIGLDFLSQNNVIEFIKKYNETTGCGVILTSHYIKDIENLANRIQLINKGKTVITGTLDEIISRFSQVKKIKVSLKEPYVENEEWQAFQPEVKNPYTIIFRVEPKDIQKLMITVSAHATISDFSMQETDLEEVLTKFY